MPGRALGADAGHLRRPEDLRSAGDRGDLRAAQRGRLHNDPSLGMRVLAVASGRAGRTLARHREEPDRRRRLAPRAAPRAWAAKPRLVDPEWVSDGRAERGA